MAKRSDDPIKQVYLRPMKNRFGHRTKYRGWEAVCEPQERIYKLIKDRKHFGFWTVFLILLCPAWIVACVREYREALTYGEWTPFWILTATACFLLICTYRCCQIVRNADLEIKKYESTQPKSKKRKRK